MIKRSAILFVFLMGACFAFSQDIPPSDQATLPYEVDTIHQVIDEALTQPVEENAYVMAWMGDTDFPLKGSAVDQKNWITQHPKSIERLLIARKKNYDKYFLKID